VRRLPVKLGRYGQLHRDQLQQSQPEVFQGLQRSGQLAKYLQDLDRSADQMKARLLNDLEKRQPYNPVKWKSRELWKAHLKRVADELVLEDRVLVPSPDPEELTTESQSPAIFG
jgi:hypothetical protein